jgi:hypothetical protein
MTTLAQQPIMDKENMVLMHNGILFSKKKKK